MTSTGTLVTRVYAARAQIPLQGVTVAVTQKANGGRTALLAVRTTDENGMTPPVRITTPTHDSGSAPGGEAPFALCTLWVETAGFELMIIRDVQIFADTETLQLVELIPLPEPIPPGARTEVVQITPQDL